MIKIENENIILRSITDEDTDNILRWRNDVSVSKFFNFQNTITEQDHRNWLETKVQTGKVCQFVIFDKMLKKDVGSVYISNIDKENRKGEFGIFLGEKDAFGKGIGTIATKETIKYAFDELSLHRLFLRVHHDNVRAIRCYNKAGFVQEGIFHDDVYANGKYIDIIIMAIINEEKNIQ